MEMYMSDGEVKTQLRIPAELHEEVKRLAEQELRSFNAQILTLLREALETRKRGKADA
jgi:hypothetical protein